MGAITPTRIRVSTIIHRSVSRRPDFLDLDILEEVLPAARKQGLDFRRVKTVFESLAHFVREAQSGQRPVDGFYVSLWRLVLRYPELLAWEHFWHESLRETYQALYQKVKAVKPNLPAGWHIWHNNSFCPLYRVEQDLVDLSRYSDFLRLCGVDNPFSLLVIYCRSFWSESAG